MKQKILIVDDSITARTLLKIHFSDNPRYEVIEAGLWADAVEKAELHQPFLIVLDYNMPEKTGGEVAKMMQMKKIKAHYVLVTANTQQSVIDEVKNLGFFDVLEKPVSAEKIHALMDRLQ